MNEKDVIDVISKKIKLIRHEKGYTQEKMAEVLGISKKTLVQIEKERIPATWTSVIATCALFRDSEVIQAALGEDPLEVIETLAHGKIDRPKEKTLGGKVWWKQIKKEKGFILQQNMISKHYRIIDLDNYRWFSSFESDETFIYFDELLKNSPANS
ncbi:helix-turn-helix transcriptional regulator [Pseudobacillus wudalianchiensis]|uniref:Transcriptional regulator n=1 Tax=Pseudobacillus wudalianchiensis TaxID=1743143 RepID=A0A1B9B8Z4_9BACI|nr:helix-turn-helix domain-containing protein [Bacillus wudalianchiensis]OCA92558.1 transcriptional regulator [Bacillus wudalianchiensis]